MTYYHWRVVLAYSVHPLMNPSYITVMHARMGTESKCSNLQGEEVFISCSRLNPKICELSLGTC